MDLKLACDRSVTFGKGICTFRHRRTASANSSAETNKCLPARSCDKCQIRSNLFAKSRSENHSESKCTDCRLLQKQNGMRKWWTLCKVFVAAVIIRTTPEEEVNESDHCTIDSQEDHIVNIDASDNSTEFSDSIQNQIDQNHQPQRANTRFKVARSCAKFLCRCSNLAAEICLAWLGQENGSNKLKNTVYWEVAFLISLVCLAISVFELIFEKDGGAEWQRRSCCYWLHYPRRQRSGNFFLYFGVGSSGIQFIINSITYWKMINYVKFEPAPLLFSFAHLIWCYKESLDRCKVHGCALQCPCCFGLYTGNEHDSHSSL